LNKGVEVEDIKSERFQVIEQLQTFIENKGTLLACGTCMKNRQKEESNFCPIATMKDMLEIVEWADKLITFG
jgi:sulfur relay (sulfurtransferase) complex TusBCD TusD component (DsrE family)